LFYFYSNGLFNTILFFSVYLIIKYYRHEREAKKITTKKINIKNVLFFNMRKEKIITTKKIFFIDGHIIPYQTFHLLEPINHGLLLEIRTMELIDFSCNSKLYYVGACVMDLHETIVL
jgi:hypothetical protein